jgi:hypothetical protein
MPARIRSQPPHLGSARREFSEMAAIWRSMSAASAPAARAAAEVQIFNQMAVALAGWQGHDETASGPVAREVRLLAMGITSDGLFPDEGRWHPDLSVTGYGPGDRIALTEPVFSRLADVFMVAIARHSR